MTKDNNSNKKVCIKCLKEKNKNNDFYISYSEWHGDGKQPICKDCLKENLDENNPNSVRNVLRAIDKPYKPDEWDKALNNEKETLGMYLKNINFNWKHETYDDGIFIKPSIDNSGNDNNDKSPPFTGDEFKNENKIYSKKWMGKYYPSEIEYLEDYWKGLDRDFRIVTENHKDYAKKIAKASLHMDKCFQEMQDGVSGADKRYKEAKDVFDTLSKSAQFSESQRGMNDVGMGSISQIVEMVESETYIYEHKNDLNKDMYDKLLDDFKHINQSL